MFTRDAKSTANTGIKDNLLPKVDRSLESYLTPKAGLPKLDQAILEKYLPAPNVLNSTFSPVQGRFGLITPRSDDAIASALDGAGTRVAGGFEVNPPQSIDKDAMLKKADAILKQVEELSSSNERTTSENYKSTTPNPLHEMLEKIK